MQPSAEAQRASTEDRAEKRRRNSGEIAKILPEKSRSISHNWSHFSLFGGKERSKNTDNSDELVDSYLHLRISRTSRKNIIWTVLAGQLSRLIKYLDSHPNQKWHIFKSLKRKPFLINVRVYEEFPSISIAIEWFEVYRSGKYYIKPYPLDNFEISPKYELKLRSI
jgi:hypothetical protein